MSKFIKDESGQDIEVFDKSEIEAAQKAAAEAKAKELEQEINPNWREARKKLSEYEEVLKKKDEELAKAGVKSEKQLDTAEVEKIAERKFLDRYKQRILDTYGDKKDVVAKEFDKLAAGEQLDETTIESIAEKAARAAGVNINKVDSSSMFSRSGGAPRFVDEASEDKGFGATPAGKATAAAMGLLIENPNKK